MKQFLFFISGVLFSLSLVSQVSILSQTNATCPGMCNGAVTLSITGGTPPYSLNVLGGPSSCTVAPMAPFSSNTITLNGLCPCLYNVVVTDAAFNLVGSTAVTITSPAPINITFSVQNVCCNGLCNGVINTFVFGGSGPYLYNWFPTGPTTGTFTGACAGTYDLCVTDMNGCAKCATTQVTQPAVFALTSSVAAASCSSCCDGQVNAFASGGNPGYTYTIYPGATTNTTGSFPNLCVGGYSVCASDNGCCTTCIGVAVPTGSATSIKNLSSKDDVVFIYPNPSHGTLYLRSQIDISEATYEIHDMLGKKIESGKAEDFSKITPLRDGVYFITIRNKDCSVISRKKVIIEH